MMSEPLRPSARLRSVTPVGDDVSTAALPAAQRIAGDDPRIALAIGGDRRAASALLAELLPRTRNLVRFLLRADADVDDLTQNALIEVLRSMGSFRGESSLTTWADRITVRTVLRQVGRQKREREQHSRSEPELASLHAVFGGADDYAARRQLALVLDGLPDAQREALVLHHVVGMSVPELAEELGLSFDTVKSRLRLGMERLRKHYLRKGSDHG
jgi:RNA polymerase sigma-70 factor (ECF subfamily)